MHLGLDVGGGDHHQKAIMITNDISFVYNAGSYIIAAFSALFLLIHKRAEHVLQN